ncbi:hypothetical protein WJX81_001776 [Elliptochloris bilobata]|uniref:Uncharacterized protein n=1 Tax=Elliptochloris bilobata TaxID=381761 RepID=A0AAW1SEY8_9CHLO
MGSLPAPQAGLTGEGTNFRAEEVIRALGMAAEALHCKGMALEAKHGEAAALHSRTQALEEQLRQADDERDRLATRLHRAERKLREGQVEKQKMELELENTMQAALMLRQELLECLDNPGRQITHPDAVCSPAPLTPNKRCRAPLAPRN